MDVASFIHHFELELRVAGRSGDAARADAIFEYPMIDRDPVPTWVEGRVALLGDAARDALTGSNGASQAIVDARAQGAAILEHSVTAAALQAHDARLCAGGLGGGAAESWGRTVRSSQSAR